MPRIVENLLQNSNFSQTSSVTNTIDIVNNRYQLWREEAKNSFPNLIPIIDNAFYQSLNQENRSSNSITLDLNILNQIGPSLMEHPREQIEGLALFAKRTLNHYILQTKSLDGNLSSADNTFRSHFSDFANTLQRAQQEVDLWVTGLADTTRVLSTLPMPKAIGDVISSINTWSTNIQTFERGIGAVVGSLLNKANNASQEIDNLAKHSSELVKEKSKANIGIEKRAQLQAEIKDVQRQLQSSQEALNATLADIGQGVELAGAIIGMSGNQQLAKQVITIGTATISIVKNLSTLITGSLATGPLAPVMAIAGAIGAIFSLFGGGGPDPMKVLSDQINNLSDHLDKRFDRIENMLEQAVKVLGEHVDRHFTAQTQLLNARFDRVEHIIGKFYRDSMQNFVGLHAGMIALQEASKRHEVHFNILEAKLTKCFQELYKEHYEVTIDKALTWSDFSKIPLDAKDISKSYYLIKRWVTDGVKNKIMTGDEELKLDYTSEYVAGVVIETGLDDNINVIKKYLTNSFDVAKNTGNLMNLSAWCKAVRAYYTFCEKTPSLLESVKQEDIQNTIGQIANDGKHFNEFIISLKTNPAFFSKLMDNYHNCLINVMHSGYKILASASAPDFDIKPQEALEAIGFLELAPVNVPKLIRHKYIQQGAEAAKYEPLPYQKARELDPYIAIGIDRTKIVSSVVGRVLAATNDIKYHGDESRKSVYNAQRGILDKDFSDAVRDELFQNHTNAGLVLVKNTNIALQHKSNYDHLNIHLNELSDARYVNEQIKIILENAARGELARASKESNSPHQELMRKFCNSIDRAQLNNKLSGKHLDIAHLYNQFTNDLKQLTIHYKILNIFIALAFSKEYTEEVEWKAYLEALWDGVSLTDYIAKDLLDCANNQLSKADCALTLLQSTIIPLSERFKEFLLEKIYALQIRAKSHIAIAGHPLVDNVLKETTLFQQYLNVRLKIFPPVHKDSVKESNASKASECKLEITAVLKSGIFGGNNSKSALPSMSNDNENQIHSAKKLETEKLSP